MEIKKGNEEKTDITSFPGENSMRRRKWKSRFAVVSIQVISVCWPATKNSKRLRNSPKIPDLSVLIVVGLPILKKIYAIPCP
jgi:hypothetical protein